MPEFLTFALVAPMASFGDLAVGERRGGFDRPARSAVLGLVGACLGIERDDDAGQSGLAAGYDVGLLCEQSGTLLADYHTAQVPPAARSRRYATRAAELSLPSHALNTILTRRDYRLGAWHLAALSARDGAPWNLPAIAEAMRRPVFTPCLGRKSCPLGLPLAPCVTDAADLPAALLARRAGGPENAMRAALLPAGASRHAPEPTEVRLTLDVAALPDRADPNLRRIEMRRDQPRSRRLWQFDVREEAVLAVRIP